MFLCYKTFPFVADAYGESARVFIPGKLLQPSLIFVSLAPRIQQKQ